MTKDELITALDKFVKSEPVNRYLYFLQHLEHKPNDWESWLQMEFAMFLSEYKSTKKSFKWWREFKVVSSKQKNGYIIPDFYISSTEENVKAGSYFIVEIKRSNIGDVIDKIVKEDFKKWSYHIKEAKTELEYLDWETNTNSGVFFLGIDLVQNKQIKSDDGMSSDFQCNTNNEKLPVGFYYSYFIDINTYMRLSMSH